MEFYADVAVTVCAFAALAASLNLLMGYGGQMSMAQAAFYGVGAYTTGLLMSKAHWGVVPSLVAAVMVSALAASAISLPAAWRVTGEHMILMTLAFEEVTYTVVGALMFTGAAYGFAVPPLSVGGHALVTPEEFLPVMVVVSAVCVLSMWGLGRSKFGRILRGMREDELALRAAGRNSAVAKVALFAVTAGVAGLVGGFMALYYQYVAPSAYGLDQSIVLIAMVVLGGSGNMFGACLGALIFEVLQALVSSSNLFNDAASFAVQGALYGAIIVVIIRFRPEGLLREHPFGGRRGRRRKSEEVGGSNVDASPIAVGLNAARAMAAPAIPMGIRGGHSAGAVAAGGIVSELRGLQPQVSGEELGRAGTAGSNTAHLEGAAMVEARGLVIEFGGVRAVDGASFVLERGSISGLIGPNGAGKTTIFNLLTGYLRPSAGTVLLEGRDIVGLPPYRIASMGMARSFQDVRVWKQMTVLDNVLVAVPGTYGGRPRGAGRLKTRSHASAARLRALEHLETVGLREQASRLVGELSFAEQKVVAVARLLATEASVLLLDEPTSGMDPGAVERMIELVHSLKNLGKTVCVVEHSLHVVEQLVDTAFFLEEGKVTAHGTLASLTNEPRLAEAYFGA